VAGGKQAAGEIELGGILRGEPWSEDGAENKGGEQ
jgi:hypothetical protein